VRVFFRFVSLARNLVRRRKTESELSDEITGYRDLLIAAHIREGLTETDALRAALLELGGVEQVKEQVREVRMGYGFETMIQDLRYAGRFLSRNPLFSLTAVLMLALGIGASTAMFSLIKSRLVRPLSYANSEGLLQISAASPFRELHEDDVSFSRFEQIRAQQNVFGHLAAFVGERLTILRGGIAEQINIARVSDEFFQMLAVQPADGRPFLPSDNHADCERVALLSHDCWQKRFNGESNIVGRSIILGDAPTTIIGILPRGFAVPFGDFDVYLPRVFEITFLSEAQIKRGAGFLKIIARPREGISLEQVRATLARIDKRYNEHAQENMDANAVCRVSPLRETAVRQARPALYAVAAAVACVLLLAAVNVVNLILGRLVRREKEIAVRYALGAGHTRILRQLVGENILLAIAAAILGIIFAWIGLATINLLGSDFLRPSEVKLDVAAIGFAAILTLGNTFLFAIASALNLPREPKSEALRQIAFLARPSLSSFRAFLIVTQVALSLLLATAAGLLLTSLHRIQNVNPGLDPDGVFVADISPPFNVSAQNGSPGRFVQRVIERLKATPDISAAAAIYGLPLAHDDTFLSYAVAGRSFIPVGARPTTWYRSVSPEYFSTMRIPLRTGRYFVDADRPGSQNVVILSETTAGLLFGNANPLGRKIICGGTIQTTYEVVGVVGDVRSLNLAQPVREEMYFSMFQCDEPSMKLIVRAAAADVAPKVIQEKIQACLHELASGQSTATPQTMRQIIAQSVARSRFVAIALAFFAGLALFVATIGIYGVMDYAASVRIREIGIRLALGARRRDVLRLIVGRGMKLVAAGLIAGGVIALCATRFLSALLYDVSANDPFVFSAAILLLAAVAFLANYLPACRAMRIAPLATLQYE
jgi:putative ABC transport system permease protein